MEGGRVGEVTGGVESPGLETLWLLWKLVNPPHLSRLKGLYFLI